VFIGFTISQVGLIRHWRRTRPPRWRLRAVLNGAGAVMTAVAVVVFLITKFLAGAWVVTIVIPLLMIMFSRTRATTPRSRRAPARQDAAAPRRRESIVVVPTTTVSLLTERVLSAALSLGETVVAVAVAGDEEERTDQAALG
jgi:ABC-type molybdate transport system permease subunit